MYVFECVTRFGLSRLALQRRNVFECETGLSLSALLLLPSLHSLLNCSEVCLRKFSKRVLTFKLKPVSPFKLLVIEVGRGSSRNVLVLLYHYEQGGLIPMGNFLAVHSALGILGRFLTVHSALGIFRTLYSALRILY